MKERRILVGVFLICILATGIIYGKWSKNINAKTNVQVGQINYGYSGPETYALVLKSDNEIYSVDMTDMKFSNDKTELQIVLDENRVKQIMNGAVKEIILSYSIMPLEGNTVADIIIDGKDIMETEISINGNNKNVAIISHVIKPEEAIEIYSGKSYEFTVQALISKRRSENQQEDNQADKAKSQTLSLHCQILIP